jgi:hypothetical protein
LLAKTAAERQPSPTSRSQRDGSAGILGGDVGGAGQRPVGHHEARPRSSTELVGRQPGAETAPRCGTLAEQGFEHRDDPPADVAGALRHRQLQRATVVERPEEGVRGLADRLTQAEDEVGELEPLVPERARAQPGQHLVKTPDRRRPQRLAMLLDGDLCQGPALETVRPASVHLRERDAASLAPDGIDGAGARAAGLGDRPHREHAHAADLRPAPRR